MREMLGGATGFNELQRGLPGISRSVLTDRMRGLERSEIVERRAGPSGGTLEYRLTLAGRDLEPVVQAIGEWGATWSFTDPRPEELDPDLLIVWMARHVDREQLPLDRTVVQFDFRNPKKRYWMVLEPSEVSVCLQHPGFDVDLEVSVDTATLYRVYLGRAELGGAMKARKLAISGPRTLQRAFTRWFTWSAFAPASRSADGRRRAASRLASPGRVRIANDGQGIGDPARERKRRSARIWGDPEVPTRPALSCGRGPRRSGSGQRGRSAAADCWRSPARVTASVWQGGVEAPAPDDERARAPGACSGDCSCGRGVVHVARRGVTELATKGAAPHLASRSYATEVGRTVITRCTQALRPVSEGRILQLPPLELRV